VAGGRSGHGAILPARRTARKTRSGLTDSCCALLVGLTHEAAPMRCLDQRSAGAAQPVTVTGVPTGVKGQIFLAFEGWISTQPLLCGKP
jgi:hypothetical protein